MLQFMVSRHFLHVSIFRRLRVRPSEGIQPTSKPMARNDEEQALPAKPLSARVTRFLKDLTVDGLGSKVPAIVGGKGTSQGTPPKTGPVPPDKPPAGPIV
jgi:hypothetical protein